MHVLVVADCQRAVDHTVAELGGLDVLVNNVATQEPVEDLGELSSGQWERTFRSPGFAQGHIQIG